MTYIPTRGGGGGDASIRVGSRWGCFLFITFSHTFLLFFYAFWQDTDRTSYYGIFDGHGGTDAAAYTVSHLHSEIAASPHYPDRPAEALREAFITTDKKFIEKSKKLVSAIPTEPTAPVMFWLTMNRMKSSRFCFTY